MSTHIYYFLYKKENHPKLSQISSYEIFSQGTPEPVRNSGGKQLICVRANEVLLYMSNKTCQCTE